MTIEAVPRETATSALSTLIQRPRAAVYGFSAVAIVLAWLWLALLAAGLPAERMDAVAVVLQNWLPSDWLGSELLRTLAALCLPVASGSMVGTFAVSFAMWTAMSIAMMLPSALPMLRTYLDIGEAAREQGKSVVPPAFLAGGYLGVWLAVAFALAALQTALAVGFGADPTAPLSTFAGAVVLLAAAAYQLSPLREACLEKCRNPFTVLFGNWSERRGDIVRLGVQQGLFCVGCCWALMSVMLVVGTMNLAWMALLTLVAVLEKTGDAKRTSLASAVVLGLWGTALLYAAATSGAA